MSEHDETQEATGTFEHTDDPIDTAIHFHCPYTEDNSGEATIKMGGSLEMMARGTLAILDRLGHIAMQEGAINPNGDELDGASAAMLLMREIHKQDLEDNGKEAYSADNDEDMNVH